MDYYLKKITLLNFKNYKEKHFTFDKAINYITGLNGSGKTSLLDAIYYLCMTKSALFGDAYSVNYSSSFFSLKGVFIKNEKPFDIFCSFENRQKKVIKLNDKVHNRLADHIGLFPCVIVLPNEANLIQGSSRERQQFIDVILCQTNKRYCQKLIDYNKVLKQRNQALKSFAEKGHTDIVLLDSLDQLLLPLGTYIFTCRQAFIDGFKIKLQTYFNYLAPEKESINLQYSSHLNELDFESILKKNRPKDMTFCRTHFGVHKDDFLFYLNNKILKYYGSQGQQKTYILALKIAHYQFIFEQKNLKPILLLDDIFDKIDRHRHAKLLELINKKGQVFITDTTSSFHENLNPYRISLEENKTGF